MPYSEKEKRLYAGLVKQYGKRAEEIYHRMLASGKYPKTFCAKSKAKYKK